MQSRVAFMLVVAACNFQRGNATGDGGDDDGGPTGDAAIMDAPIDAPPGSVCVGSFVEVCRPMAETMVDLTIDVAGPIDTDHDPRCIVTMIAGGPTLCVIAGHNIKIAPNVKVTAIGDRPLVFAAFDNFKIEAASSLSVSSTSGRKGAGANYTGCVGVGMNGDDSVGGAGGGAGGSMRGKGSNGGKGDGDLTAAGIAQEAFPAVFTFVHGGCAGGNGGGSGGTGGASGGAVLVIAKKNIELKAGAFIVASGARGSAPDSNSGGGGGGSGGFIGLDAGVAIVLDANAHFAANGGSGAAGGTVAVGGPPGNDGDDTAVGVSGGSGGTGGVGGSGSGGAALTGGMATGGLPTSGGGGGGGGAGAIILFDKGTATGPYSPLPTQQ